MHYETTIDPVFKLFAFESTVKFSKGDWGILPDSDKEDNQRAIKEGGDVIGVYKMESKLLNSEIFIILPASRESINVLFKREVEKGSPHIPVLYNSRGKRISN